jgi:hypothetical protein
MGGLTVDLGSDLEADEWCVRASSAEELDGMAATLSGIRVCCIVNLVVVNNLSIVSGLDAFGSCRSVKN